MRGHSIEGLAGRVQAQASEHHGDGATAYRALAAVFVEDEEGGRTLHHHETPGEDREAVRDALMTWLEKLDDPAAVRTLGPAQTEGIGGEAGS